MNKSNFLKVDLAQIFPVCLVKKQTIQKIKHPLINLSINQTIKRKSIKQTIKQWNINQSNNQTINQTNKQSIKQSQSIH